MLKFLCRCLTLKIYTFEYNMEVTGVAYKGECDWSQRMIELDSKTYAEIIQQFKRDFIEYQKFPNAK